MNFYETVNLTYIFLGVSNVLNGLTYIFMLLHVCSEIRASNSLRHRGIFEISAHNYLFLHILFRLCDFTVYRLVIFALCLHE